MKDICGAERPCIGLLLSENLESDHYRHPPSTRKQHICHLFNAWTNNNMLQWSLRQPNYQVEEVVEADR